jgi:hypothetical protein
VFAAGILHGQHVDIRAKASLKSFSRAKAIFAGYFFFFVVVVSQFLR